MSKKKALPKDADLAGVDTALKRAAKKARELAAKTHTPLYVFEDGKVVERWPGLFGQLEADFK